MDMSLNKLQENGEGQGSLACCSSWSCKELDTIELLNNKNRNTGVDIHSHGQRHLMGYSPWGHKDSDTAEVTNTSHSAQNIRSGFSGSAGKESACNVGDLSSIHGLERSPVEGKGYPLQYSALEIIMNCIVDGVTKSQTQLSNFHFSRKDVFTFYIFCLR